MPGRSEPAPRDTEGPPSWREQTTAGCTAATSAGMQARALGALVLGAVAIAPGVAHASGFGTVQVIADDAHGAPDNGVCLEIVVPGPKNSADVVVASGVSTGGGVAGLISVGNVPVGNYIARFDDCGSATSFSSFYYGGTFNKAAAPDLRRDRRRHDEPRQPAHVELGQDRQHRRHSARREQSRARRSRRCPLLAYTASGKNLLTQGCTDQNGHYTLFELPHTGGGVKLYFGNGASCSNDGNFVPQWYGGSSYATATPITIATNGNVTANNVTLTPVTKANTAVTSVSFAGSPANPIVTVLGHGFGGKSPAPNPATRPCGEPDVAGNGYDYGNNVVFWDLNDSALWQAGFPGDCIGLNFVSYSSTQIVFTLGDWYRDPANGMRPLAVGDQFTVRIKGCTAHGNRDLHRLSSGRTATGGGRKSAAALPCRPTERAPATSRNLRLPTPGRTPWPHTFRSRVRPVAAPARASRPRRCPSCC